MTVQGLSRIGVVAALLLTGMIASAQAVLPVPAAPDAAHGSFEPPVPFYVPPEYQSQERKAIVIVNTTVDENDGECGGGTGVSLREALTVCLGDSGSAYTVFVNSGTYQLVANIHITQFSALTIIGSNPTTTIIRAANGPCVVCTGLVVNLSDTPLVLMNLTIENGNVAATDGAGLFVSGYGTVDIYNVVFRGNRASTGGALTFYASDFSILAAVKHTTFENNHSSFSGGAIQFASAFVSDNQLLLSHVLFQGNTSMSEACSTGDGGGAVMMRMGVMGNALTITDSTFNDNSSGCGYGGAVNIRSAGFMTISIMDSTFTNNRMVDGEGSGAVSIAGSGVTVDISASTFTGNSGQYGGGLDVYGAQRVSITESLFSENTAGTSGGGMYIGQSMSVSILDSTLINNTAAYGGGALVEANPIMIASTNISGNTATAAGGGLYSFDMATTLRGSALVDNSAPSGPDCFIPDEGTLISFNGNMISNTGGCNILRQRYDEFDNLLVNGGFEVAQTTPTANAKKPAGWTLKNLSGDKRVCNAPNKPVAMTGICAFSFSGGPGANASLSQTISLAGHEVDTGDSLLLSAIGAGVNASKVQLDVTVKFADATPNKVKKKLTFKGNTGGYAYLDAELLELVSTNIASITVKVTDKSTSGKFLLDNVFLTLQPPSLTRAAVDGILPPPTAPEGFRSGN